MYDQETFSYVQPKRGLFTAVTEMLIENQVIYDVAGLVNAPLGSDDGFVSHTVSSIQHSFIKH